MFTIRFSFGATSPACHDFVKNFFGLCYRFPFPGVVFRLNRKAEFAFFSGFVIQQLFR